ncbi:FtsW/RodA/SpoVE family cell cycle protein [Mucilaginibacter sp. 14171R-50]|uniref:FtsW/RodA/SpoVE family cell cycle protein n=1 Tax=Mucilaginibacter sp. 14171R-50 TaxID=2703789 RepID=UPI00138C85A2|nr:FtsW/RodA/SpoVE family cell cycle protein [Mucilaginibacter sp. 14171R-50]QHS57538.1 FtsW/RodA/SpoVE family cell cycle protein [Mucilaginibacter sp. 14171R-50]
MEADKVQSTGRWKERVFLLLISVLLVFLFFRLYSVLQLRFADVDTRLQDGTMINLNAKDPAGQLKKLLTKGYYFEDKRDIDLITATVAGNIGTGQKIDNIGELNKRKYFIIADDAFEKGGESFKSRVNASRALLGYTGDDSVTFVRERTNPLQVPSSTDLGMGGYSITGAITEKKQPVAGVLIRLEMILPQDSIYNDEEVEDIKLITENGNGFKKVYLPDSAGKRHLQELTAYARTNQQGIAEFKNLPAGKAFKLLPLQPGYQFGRSQGVQNLDEDVSLTFSRQPHTIRLFSTRDFNILKKERSLIVRTPAEFNQWFLIIAGSFIGAFLFVHLLLSWKYRASDQLILPVVMILAGLSFLTLLSLQDPLRDRFLAKDMLVYLGIGLVAMLVMLQFKLRRFTPDSWIYRMLVFKHNRNAANGWPWVVLAATLLAMTIKFGTGPEGSGVKVNLFGFQPSEIVKYLIILFLAGFFAANEKLISEYSSWSKRWQFFSFALIAILVTLLLFLLLGDLGPAMVVCFTFIVLFSFSRGDFMFMAGAVVLYVIVSWVVKNVWLSALITAGITALFMLFKRRSLSESAIMVLVIMAAFLTIDQIPYLGKLFPGPVQRLVDRKAIWQDAWNNEVYGGDQVANGLWAMSSGGVSGQGVGEGFAKTIPEAHTDMILPSMGEEFGWTGIVCIFLLFLVYLHRAIIIGRRTGTPFLFYLCAGIGISTFVQFMLIAGGSTGALPLSGVSLPFQSYGGSSLVANLLASGFLLSASLVQGTPVQMSYISRQQDKNLVPALIAACVAITLLTVNVSRYLFNNKKWVVQPALVADKSGMRMFSYNPRIAILMNRLQAGNLYDRDGVVLATSKPELIKKQHRELVKAGAIGYNIDSAMHKRLDRYYPFDEQMFFWTGDANTGVFNGSPNGYFAEYEHAAELRGFKMPTEKFNVTANRYQEDRFLARGVKEMTVVKKDYSAIAPLLIAGINSKEVEAFKNRNRDVKLTMDAGLQTSIQNSIAQDTSLLDNRVSVVVMESNTGDVLTSAMYPLPPVHDWEKLTMSYYDQNQLAGWTTTQDLGFTLATQPGSTAKLATSIASFNKLGLAAADKKYNVASYERIRTKGFEPDETGLITLERAVAKSNNVYFIKLANQEHLQEDMATVYLKTGMFLHGVGGYYYGRDKENAAQEEKWRELWRKTEFNTRPRYDPNNIRKTRAKGISGMAWGQGELIATPASVARMAAGIANHGVILQNRYVLKVADSTISVKPGVKLTNDPKYAALLRQYMIEQSAPKEWTLGIAVAGKTGTPERIWKKQQINDGWYVFFAPKANGVGNMVVCIRIESTKGSSDAVKLAGKHVIPFLREKGYIKSIKEQTSE